MSIKSPSLVRVVHPDYRKSRQKVWLDADIDGSLAGEKIDALTQERLVWGRTLMMMLASPALPAMQPGLSTTYCGHTIDMWVRSYLSHVCLDTGAYQSHEANNFGLLSIAFTSSASCERPTAAPPWSKPACASCRPTQSSDFIYRSHQ